MTNTPRARKMIARVARSSGSRSSRLIHTSQESEEPGAPPGLFARRRRSLRDYFPVIWDHRFFQASRFAATLAPS
jgi:hypothetical protein